MTGHTDRWTRDLTLALGLLLLVVFACEVAQQLRPNTWIFRDGRFYVNVNENLLDDLSLEDPFAHSWYDGQLGWNRNLPASFSNIAVGARGEFYHFRPYLLPVLATPLYFAFGLPGTLLFNVLCLVLVGACGFRFARAYASAELAALASVAFLLATGLQMTIYNYSVDVLLLALFVAALACVTSGRGFLAGALFAATLTIKPTTIIHAIPLVLLFLERRDVRGIGRAVLGGAVVLGVAAAINTYMYGRPWWFGYNRVLAVVDGEPTIVSDVDAFTTPFEEGWERMYRGHWGLRPHYRLHLLAALGAVVLVARKPLYVIATIGASVGAVMLFARFEYEGDRFLYPALALQVPAIAVGVGALVRAIAAGVRGARRWLSALPPPDASALAAAVLVVAAAVASFGTSPPIEERIATDAWLLGARTLAHEGTLDMTAVPEVDATLTGEASVATLGRFGHLLPRAPLPAVIVAAPFVGLGGKAGVLVLSLIAAAVAAWSATKVLGRVAPPPLAAAAVLATATVDPLASTLVTGGPGLLGAAAALLACHLALERRWAAAAALAVLGAWIADAPWLLAVGVLALAALEGGARRAAMSGGVVLALWGGLHLLLIGRPFASPEDFVAVRLAVLTGVRVPGPSFAELLARAVEDAGAARALLPLLAVGPLGALAALRRDARVGVLLVSLLASLPLCAVEAGHARWAPLAMWSLGACAAPLAWAVAVGVGRVSRRRLLGGVGAACVALVLVGGVRRAADASAPFEMSSPRAVRHATVTLDTIPCDFLAWENMSWECSSFDGGRIGRAGLALPDRITVAGEVVEMLHVPTGRHGHRARTVRWDGVPVGVTLQLTYAPVDGFHRGARVVISVDDEEADRFDVVEPGIARRAVDTSRWAGRDATLQIEVRTLAAGQQAAVAFDGHFE